MAEKQTTLYLRRAAKQRFNRNEKNLMNCIESGDDLDTVQSILEELQAAWDTAQKRHDDHMATQDDNGSDDEDLWITELSNRYYQSKRKVGEYIQKAKSKDKKDHDEKVRLEELERVKIALLKEAERKQIEENEEEKRKERTCMENRTLRDQEEAKSRNLINHIIELMKGTDPKENVCTAQAIKLCLENLKEVIHKCIEFNSGYIKLRKDTSESEDEKQWVTQLWNLYNKCSTDAQIFIAKYESKTPTKDPNIRDNGNNIRIEKIKLDTFCGEIRKYARFKEEFTAHIKPECKRGQEAFVLKSYLSAEIKDEVDSYGEDIESIWKFLDSRYGSRRKLVDTIMTDVKNAKISGNKPTENPICFINTVEKAHRDLQRLGMTNEIENATIIGQIENQLTGNIREEWVKLAIKKVDMNLFPYLLKFLGEVKSKLFDTKKRRVELLTTLEDQCLISQKNSLDTEHLVGYTKKVEAILFGDVERS